VCTAAACRRDQALAAIKESIMKQQQQELAIETEIQGYKKDIHKEQVCGWGGSQQLWSAVSLCMQSAAQHHNREVGQHASDNVDCCVHCFLQIRNEQLSNTVRKVQGECEFVLKQAATAAEKQETLAVQLAKLTSSLEQTEERIKQAMQETKVCWQGP
jgi:hypothetical protein